MTVSLAQFLIISSRDILKAHLIYNATVLSLFVFVPFIVTLAAFIRIYIIMKQSKESRMKMSSSRRSNGTQRKKQRINVKRSVIIYLAMLICFVFAWFPYFFLTLLIDLDNSLIMRIPQWISVMFLFLKISSALFNPFLFTFFKADFQKALRQMASGNLTGSNSVSRGSMPKNGSNRSTYV